MKTPRKSRDLTLVVLGVLSLLATLASSAPLERAHASQIVTDISIKLSENQTTVMLGRDITYQVVTTNLGPDNASFVDLAFTLPSQLKFVSLSCGLGISSDGSFCEYSSLPAGSHVTSRLVATPYAGAEARSRLLRTSAAISFENVGILDPDPDNNTASIRTLLLVRSSHP